MQHTIHQLEKVINDYGPGLHKLKEEGFLSKPRQDKWSKKEILGHLVDSAQNNIRRFVVAQYEDQPSIGYNQDKWVLAASYQQYDTADLVNLWILLNKHICMLLKNLPEGVELRECKTDRLRSIEWLAEDYIRHLRHHLHQLLDLEPVAYP